MRPVILVVLLSLVALAACQVECNRPNEHYECGSACQTTCENLGQPCPINNVRCNDACYCNSDYARDSTGICIPVSECPSN